MAQVVHPDQTCGVPGRMCGMNLALVRDTLAWAEQQGVPLALLSLDQEKAFDRVSTRADSWGKRDLSLTGRVVAANSDMLADLNHLACVFPIPFMIGKRMERMLFTFIWGGSASLKKDKTFLLFFSYTCIPLRIMVMYVAFLAKLVGGVEGHMASLFAKFWIGFAMRTVIPWRGTSPWSTDHPWHYQKVAEFIHGQPWCLVDGIVKLYRRWRDCWAAQSGETLPRVPGVEWAALQPTWLDKASKDLHWLGALGRLPVRERLYRHSISRTPLCPVGCGGGETVEHTLWSCPIAAQLWKRVSEWWSAEGEAGINRDLVLYGSGLKRM
ncbi:uncharacterized protein LOC115161469 [Tachysurus ichikawai]